MGPSSSISHHHEFLDVSCSHLLWNTKQSVMSKRAQERRTEEEPRAVEKARPACLVSRNLLSEKHTTSIDSGASHGPVNQEMGLTSFSGSTGKLARDRSQNPTTHSQERQEDGNPFRGTGKLARDRSQNPTTHSQEWQEDGNPFRGTGKLARGIENQPRLRPRQLRDLRRLLIRAWSVPKARGIRTPERAARSLSTWPTPRTPHASYGAGNQELGQNSVSRSTGKLARHLENQLGWTRFEHRNPQVSDSLYIEKVLKTLRQKLNCLENDKMLDVNTNALIWGLFVSTTKEASVHRGPNYNENLEVCRNTNFEELKTLFDFTQQLIFGQHFEILNVFTIWVDTLSLDEIFIGTTKWSSGRKHKYASARIQCYVWERCVNTQKRMQFRTIWRSTFNDIHWTKNGIQKSVFGIPNKSKTSQKCFSVDTGHPRPRRRRHMVWDAHLQTWRKNEMPLRKTWWRTSRKRDTQYFRGMSMLNRGTEKKRLKMYKVIHFTAGISECRAVVSHDSLDKPVKYVRSSSEWAWRFDSADSWSNACDQGDIRRKGTISYLKSSKHKMWTLQCRHQGRMFQQRVTDFVFIIKDLKNCQVRGQITKACEPAGFMRPKEVESLEQTQERNDEAVGNRSLCVSLPKFDELEKERFNSRKLVNLRRLWEVSVGMLYKDIHDVKWWFSRHGRSMQRIHVTSWRSHFKVHCMVRRAHQSWTSSSRWNLTLSWRPWNGNADSIHNGRRFYPEAQSAAWRSYIKVIQIIPPGSLE